MSIALKSLQTVATILLTYTTYSLLQGQVFQETSLNELDSPVFPDLSKEILQDPPDDVLLDIRPFKFLLEPHKNVCLGQDVLFYVIIHSHPSHFVQRSTIRSTWGGLKRIVENGHTWQIELVFLLGSTNNSRIHKKIFDESRTYDDIVQGSFIDSYHNLTYKHLMGYKWASTKCPQAQFILKTDDDAFVDVPGLYRYLVRVLGHFKMNYSRDFLAGNVFPQGTAVKRHGKWAVNTLEYPWNRYPSYLGGLAYLVTPNLAKDLFKAAHHTQIQRLWVDDVFVTGVLAASLNVHPLYMNMRYAYDEDEIGQLMSRPKQAISMPYTFYHLDTSKHYATSIAVKLWNNAKRIYSISGSTFDAFQSLEIDEVR